MSALSPDVTLSLLDRLRAGRPRPGELRQLLALARPQIHLVSVALVLMVASTAISLVVPLVLAQLLDQVLVVGDHAAMARLNRLGVVLLVLSIARALFVNGHAFLITMAGERVVLALRRKLYDHLVTLSPSFFDRERVGELVSRVMSDVAQIQAAVTADLAGLVTTVATLVGAVGLLLWQSWRLMVVISVLVPPVIVIGRAFGRLMRRYGVLQQDRTAALTAVVDETLDAIRLVQIFGREPHERERVGRVAIDLYRVVIERARVQLTLGSVVLALSLLALVLTVWFGGREVLGGRLTIGTLLVIVAYSGMIANSSSNLVSLYGRWATALGASRRVFELLGRTAAIADRADARTLGRAAGRLTFDRVSFAYVPGQEVLHRIELEVAPGETLALVGPSGAGKTTLVHLVARFYDPGRGRVLVDGIDLRGLTLASWRAQLGTVPQETLLFNATVAENLRYGRLGASDAEVEAAARAAYAHDFVTRMPDGYETVVGARGYRLSAGERQRLAIARALLRDPRVLLLDEATSSLDNESELLVQAALERLTAGRTTIVIAHRLSTVRGADRIAVLDRGHLVELGSHERLVAAGGLYARLHALQFRAPDGPVAERAEQTDRAPDARAAAHDPARRRWVG